MPLAKEQKLNFRWSAASAVLGARNVVLCILSRPRISARADLLSSRGRPLAQRTHRNAPAGRGWRTYSDATKNFTRMSAGR